MKAKESKEKAGEQAAEKKAKAAQEAALLKKEKQRKKEEDKADPSIVKLTADPRKSSPASRVMYVVL